MSESLVIRLPARPRDPAAWVAVDDTGALLGPAGHGLLEEAQPAAAGRQVIALVPALDILRIRAEVPVRTGARLLQALPFALEEQLADDVDDLHFAAGARDSAGRVPVAVTRRAVMADWLERLRQAGLAPHRAYAESDAVPIIPNTFSLVVDDTRVVLADPDGEATAIDAEALEPFLELWLQRRQAAGATEPIHVVATGTAEQLAPYTLLWERVRPRVESLELRATPEGALPRLAAQIATAGGVNLLQGEYAQHAGLAAYWPAWRASAALAAGAAILAIVVQLLEIRALRNEASHLDQAIDQAFQYVFPDAGPVSDPRAELSARLQRLGSQGGGASHEFLDALRVVSQAVAGGKGTRIEGLSYRPGSMELRLRAPSVEALDRIQQTVSQSGGLSARIQSANASGNEVEGRLQITRAGG